MKKPGKTMELTNSLQIQSWRQRLATEEKIAKVRDQQDLQRLEHLLEEKNTYMHYFKNEEVKEKEKLESSKTQFLYDQSKSEEDNNYCKKCKYESKWCKHRQEREDAKQKLGASLTTTQQYGWREPYDNLTNGYNRSGVCKRTFYDFGHLS